jgi:hypothetical protein
MLKRINDLITACWQRINGDKTRRLWLETIAAVPIGGVEKYRVKAAAKR